MASPDPGSGLLARVTRDQVILLPLGVLAWVLASGREAALAFTLGGLTSLAFWILHRLIVARMLTPRVRLRWFYGFLTLVKLALIAVLLHGIMDRLPNQGGPLASGLALFVAAILVEAARLTFSPMKPGD